MLGVSLRTRWDTGQVGHNSSNNNNNIIKVLFQTQFMAHSNITSEVYYEIMFMAPRLKIDSKFSYFGADFWNICDVFDLLLQIEGLEAGRNVAHVSKIRSKVRKCTINVLYSSATNVHIKSIRTSQVFLHNKSFHQEHIVRRMLDVDIPGKRSRGRPNLKWKDTCREIWQRQCRRRTTLQTWYHRGIRLNSYTGNPRWRDRSGMKKKSFHQGVFTRDVSWITDVTHQSI